MPSTRLRFLAALWLILPAQLVGAPAPSVSFLYPSGRPLHSTNVITLSGVEKTWPLQAWTKHPQLSFSPREKAGQMIVSIGPDVPPGPHLVHFLNSNGVAQPKIFMVGSLPEREDSEPNDAFGQAQSITNLPVTIHGKLNKNGDVDSFRFPLEAGQRLRALVDAYTLDSPMDAILHIKDASGATLAFNHDGINLDPLLTYQAKSAGDYVVQLAAFAYPPQANVRFTGSDKCIYRLNLTIGPVSDHTPPFKETAQSLSNPYPWSMEQEPNQVFTNAPLLELPHGIRGRMDQDGDVDRFRFQANQGDIIVATLSSAGRGFPVDAVLQIENQNGKSLVRSDDTDKKLDPSLTWKTPENGIYACVVSDLYNKGGSNHIYHLDIAWGLPDFTVRLNKNSFLLEPGTTVEIKATVERQHGHTNEIRIIAEHLPSGITMKEVTAPEKGGETLLKLTAAKDAIPGQQQIRILGSSQTSDQEEAIRKHAQIPFKGSTTEAGDLLINETGIVWLTIPRLPAPTASE